MLKIHFSINLVHKNSILRSTLDTLLRNEAKKSSLKHFKIISVAPNTQNTDINFRTTFLSFLRNKFILL